MKLLSFNIGKFVYNIWSREPGAFRLFTLLIIIFCFLLVRGSTKYMYVNIYTSHPSSTLYETLTSGRDVRAEKDAGVCVAEGEEGCRPLRLLLLPMDAHHRQVWRQGLLNQN